MHKYILVLQVCLWWNTAPVEKGKCLCCHSVISQTKQSITLMKTPAVYQATPIAANAITEKTLFSYAQFTVEDFQNVACNNDHQSRFICIMLWLYLYSFLHLILSVLNLKKEADSFILGWAAWTSVAIIAMIIISCPWFHLLCPRSVIFRVLELEAGDYFTHPPGLCG